MSALAREPPFWAGVRGPSYPESGRPLCRTARPQSAEAGALPPLDLAEGALVSQARRYTRENAGLLGGGYGLEIFVTRVERTGRVGAYNSVLWIGPERHGAQQTALPASRRAERTGWDSARSTSLHDVMVA